MHTCPKTGKSGAFVGLMVALCFFPSAKFVTALAVEEFRLKSSEKLKMCIFIFVHFATPSTSPLVERKSPFFGQGKKFNVSRNLAHFHTRRRIFLTFCGWGKNLQFLALFYPQFFTPCDYCLFTLYAPLSHEIANHMHRKLTKTPRGSTA